MTIADQAVEADATMCGSDLAPVIARLPALLARVSSGEVSASPGFEQRLYGGLVALEAVASGAAINVRTLVRHWSAS